MRTLKDALFARSPTRSNDLRYPASPSSKGLSMLSIISLTHSKSDSNETLSAQGTYCKPRRVLKPTGPSFSFEITDIVKNDQL
ncbi:MAG: hypothetical protein M1587_07295, partial [Thaumarchaeota archaeon]|nr:hypothetical protein [Nitrososphaerota archaeon]